MLTGENGIINKSNWAKEQNNEKTASEIMNLKITQAQITSYVETQQMPTLQYLANCLCEDEEIEYVELESKKMANQKDYITVPSNASIYTKLNEYPYEFEIDENLKLASINGVKVATDNNIDYDELKKEISDLKNQVNVLKEETTLLKTEILSDKRILLSSETKEIPVTSSWNDNISIDIDLTDTMRNYKYIEIQVNIKYINVNNSSECGATTVFIATEQIKNLNDSNNKQNDNNSTFAINANSTPGDSAVLWAWFKKENILHIGASKGNNSANNFNLQIKNIYGIK